MKLRYDRKETDILPGIWKNSTSIIMKYISASAHIDSLLEKVNRSLDDDLRKTISKEVHFLMGIYGSKCSISTQLPECTNLSVLSEDIESLITVMKDMRGLDGQIDKLSFLKDLINGNSSSTKDYYGCQYEKPRISFIPYKYPSQIPSYPHQYMQEKSVKQYLKKQVKTINIHGIKQIVHELGVFKLSYDGVSVYKFSTLSNSITAICLTDANVHHSLSHNGTDIWLGSLTPAISPLSLSNCLQSSSDVTLLSKKDKMLYRLFCQAQLTSNVRKSSKRYIDRSPLPRFMSNEPELKDIPIDNYNHGKTIGNATPSDSLGRCILHLCLERMRKEGSVGVPFIRDNTIHFVNYAVICLLADIPAADNVYDSSGKKNSNTPCRDCPALYSKWNSMTNSFSSHLDWILPSKDPKSSDNDLKLLLTSLASLERDNILRLLPVIYFLKDHSDEEIVDYLYSLVANDEVTRDYIREAVHIIHVSLESLDFPLWIPPTTDVFCEYTGEDSDKMQATNNPLSFGKVDLEDSTIIGKTHFHGKDVMHFMGNLYDAFMMIIHNKQSFDKSLLSKLNRELMADHIISSDLKVPEIPSWVLEDASQLFSINENLLSQNTISLIKACLSNDSASLTTHDKMLLMWTIIPWIFQSGLTIPVIRTFINLSVYCGVFYTYRGDLSGAKDISVAITTQLYFLENLLHVSGLTINYHYSLHWESSYEFLGILKNLDCLYGESFYKRLRDQGGTPKPYLSLFLQQKNITMSSFYAFQLLHEDSISNTVNCYGSAIVLVLASYLTPLQWKVFTYFSLIAKEQYCYCDFAPLPTLLDILLNTTIPLFLSTQVLPVAPKEFGYIQDNQYFSATDGELRSFLQDQSIEESQLIVDRLDHLCLMSELKIGNTHFKSIDKLFSQLSYDDLYSHKNAFFVLIDTNGVPHLMCMIGYYVALISNKTRHCVGFGYDIPLDYLSNPRYCYLFNVNLTHSQDRRVHIVDISRLHPDFEILSNQSIQPTIRLTSTYITQFIFSFSLTKQFCYSRSLIFKAASMLLQIEL